MEENSPSQSTPNESPSKFAVILFFILCIIVALLTGTAYGLMRGNTKTPKTNIITQKPIASDLTLPIDKNSSLVESVHALYLLKGVVSSMKESTDKQNAKHFDLILRTPDGILIPTAYNVPLDLKYVVRMDNNQKEVTIPLSEIKVNTLVFVNYTYDVKNPTSSQVTRIVKMSQ